MGTKITDDLEVLVAYYDGVRIANW